MSSGNDAGSSRGMDWMYKGPAALVDREDYLTGRTVDKALKILDEAEKGNTYSYLDDVQKDLTPASIFSTTNGGPTDVIRKVKEDPLYQIQKKEEEYLKQLLSNPVKMKQLRQLAEQKKAEESQKASGGTSKRRKDRKRRSSSSSSSDSGDDVEIDKLLAQKLSSMKNAKEILLSKRKAESSSSSDSDDTSSRVKSSKSARTTEEKVRMERGDERRDNRDRRRDRSRSRDRGRRPRSRSRSRERRRSWDRSHDRNSRDKRYSDSRPTSSHKPPPSDREKRKPLDESERERRLREMMENANWRESQRSANVSKMREEQKKEEERSKTERDADFIRKQLVVAAEQGSVEKRIKSNSYNIQRSKSSMNQNFARR